MEGSNLSPRVFTELFERFKRQKVEISHAIKTTFPFLEGLRDNNLISSKMYEDFQESCRLLVPVQKVIYRALDKLEKKFDMKVLHELFSEVNMEKYPDLKRIHRSFKNVLQNELFFYRSNGGGPNSQLSLGKGPRGSSSQRSLTWSSLDPSSSEGRRSNDRRNSSLIRGNQTETHQLSESPNHLVSSLPEDGLSEDLCENVLIRRVRRDAATNTDKSTNKPERKPAIMPRGPGSVPEGAEGLSHGFQINPCSVPLVDIKKEKSSFSLHGNQQTGARINQNEDSEVIELSSDDSDGGDNFPEASTLVPSQPEPTYSRKPPTPRTDRRDTVDVGKNPILGKDGGKRRGKRAILGNYLKRNIKIPMKASWKTDFLARSVNPSWGRKRGWTIPRHDLANFRGTELPVKCGNVEGTLHKEKFKQGIYTKSIKSQTGQWLTPMEFEIEGKREKSKNWRQSIRCKKVTLRELIKIGVLQDPPRKKVAIYHSLQP